MAKIRNTSGQDLNVPGVGLVEADAVATIADAATYSFTQQAIWEPADGQTQKLHDKAAAVYAPAKPTSV